MASRSTPEKKEGDPESAGQQRRAGSESVEAGRADAESLEGQGSLPVSSGASAGDDSSPRSLLMRLQETHGNAFVQRLMAEWSGSDDRSVGQGSLVQRAPQHVEQEHVRNRGNQPVSTVEWASVGSDLEDLGDVDRRHRELSHRLGWHAHWSAAGTVDLGWDDGGGCTYPHRPGLRDRHRSGLAAMGSVGQGARPAVVSRVCGDALPVRASDA